MSHIVIKYAYVISAYCETDATFTFQKHLMFSTGIYESTSGHHACLKIWDGLIVHQIAVLLLRIVAPTLSNLSWKYHSNWNVELNLPVEELMRIVIREDRVSIPWENLEFSENFLLWKIRRLSRWNFIEIRRIL